MTYFSSAFRQAITLFALCLSSSVWAQTWQLDANHSRLSFVSVKATHVAEVSEFRQMAAEIDAQGQLRLEIDLASVDTKVTIRDERMRAHLFKTDEFATATLSADLQAYPLEDFAIGIPSRVDVQAELDLHGQTQTLLLSVLVTRLSADTLIVFSAHPVLLDAAQFDLVAGVDTLREMVGLPSISHAVPVSFYLTFQAQ